MHTFTQFALKIIPFKRFGIYQFVALGFFFVSCGHDNTFQNAQTIIDADSALMSSPSNSDSIQTCDLPAAPKGRFSIGLGIDTLQMCVPGERIICNAFVIGMAQNISIQIIDNILGPSLNCPTYATMRNKFNIKSEKCNLMDDYTAEIHCVNMTTQKFWIAPTGSFKIQCTETAPTQVSDENDYYDEYIQYTKE